MLEEAKVKWPSKNPYNCKRNKGEHEYLEPVITYKPNVRYIYKSGNGNTLNSHEHEKDGNYKFLNSEISLATETKCKHCGHKVISFFNQKL